ncbi:hypothetical protein OSTOST_01705, partial [Ostertagia ostertagi]
MLHFSCLLSILSGSRKDAHLVLKKWIHIGVSLARNGDAFACACIAGALLEKALTSLTWLWNSLDVHAKSEYATLKSINESLVRGEKLEVHNYSTVVPFLQPTLEILSNEDSHYLDGTSFASESRCGHGWIEPVIGAWRLTNHCKAARIKFARADGSVMTHSFLCRLFIGAESHKDRLQVVNGVIQRIADEC